MSVRLDRLLANLGYGSRREVQNLIARGAVILDGAKLFFAAIKNICLGCCCTFLHGTPLSFPNDDDEVFWVQ